MTALQILDIKEFMGKLLKEATFDNFLLSEAIVTTYQTFTIDGYLHKEFFSEEELAEKKLEGLQRSYWSATKPFCFELMKGKHTPLNFKIIFMLSPSNVVKLLQQTKLQLEPQDVSGLFLNIKFDGKELYCITGTSLNIFSMDKALENAWDEMVKRFFKQQGVAFEVK